MNYLLVYYGFSKYYQCSRKHHMEFDHFGCLLKFIIDKKIQKFTIYKKYDIVEIEDKEENNG